MPGETIDKRLIDAMHLLCLYAEKNLPEGYTITAVFGKEEASLELTDPCDVPIDVDSDRDISQFRRMCDFAKDDWKEQNGDE